MADLPDPSTLTDEELAAAISGEPVEPETPPETPEPEVEETPEEEVVEELEEVAEPEDEPKPPSRRESLRLQQLLEKYGSPSPQTAPKPRDTPDTLNYQETLDADPELIKRLEEDRRRSQEQSYNQGLEQAKAIEWRTLLAVDAPAVEMSHAQLNPRDQENFHPTLANTLNSFYLTMSGFDPQTQTATKPGMRYSDFIDCIYELAEEISATKVQTTAKNVAKQAAKTGLRPDGSSAKRLNLNKAPQDMTDEELAAYLDKHIPKA